MWIIYQFKDAGPEPAHFARSRSRDSVPDAKAELEPSEIRTAPAGAGVGPVCPAGAGAGAAGTFYSELEPGAFCGRSRPNSARLRIPVAIIMYESTARTRSSEREWWITELTGTK